MNIAAGQGQTTPGDKILMSRETTCHFGHLLQVSKKSLLSLIYYNFFHDFIHVYSPGAGLTTPYGQIFYVNRNILSLWSFVASLIRISLKSDYIQFFHDFIHVCSPGAGADSSQGTKFWCQQKCLVISFICCKFKKKNVFEVWFYTIFLCLRAIIARFPWLVYLASYSNT